MFITFEFGLTTFLIEVTNHCSRFEQTQQYQLLNVDSRNSFILTVTTILYDRRDDELIQWNHDH